MSILGFFKAIGRFLTGAANKVANVVNDLAPKVLPIVEMIATLTPTRKDDEIIALFNKFALPNVQAFLLLPEADRGLALLSAGTKLAQKQWPNIPVSQIQAALQMALLAFKNGAKSADLAPALPPAA